MTDNTFNPSFFELFKKAEGEHFWFRVRRKWIFDKIKKFIKPPARLLEIGCGTGNISSFLASRGYFVTRCEFYPEAIEIAWPGFIVIQGDANNLPLKDGSFDIVGLFDEIELFQDESIPIKEAIRVLRQGGIIIITVPAREELWSDVDEKSFHKRRYTKEKLGKIFSKMKLKILQIEYMFMSLYFSMKYMRSKNKHSSDLFKINKFLNFMLTGIFAGERIISKRFYLPIGTSLIAISRK